MAAEQHNEITITITTRKGQRPAQVRLIRQGDTYGPGRVVHRKPTTMVEFDGRWRFNAPTIAADRSIFLDHGAGVSVGVEEFAKVRELIAGGPVCERIPRMGLVAHMRELHALGQLDTPGRLAGAADAILRRGL